MKWEIDNIHISLPKAPQSLLEISTSEWYLDDFDLLIDFKASSLNLLRSGPESSSEDDCEPEEDS